MDQTPVDELHSKTYAASAFAAAPAFAATELVSASSLSLAPAAPNWAPHPQPGWSATIGGTDTHVLDGVAQSADPDLAVALRDGTVRVFESSAFERYETDSAQAVSSASSGVALRRICARCTPVPLV
jgi:hypothetical protein